MANCVGQLKRNGKKEKTNKRERKINERNYPENILHKSTKLPKQSNSCFAFDSCPLDKDPEYCVHTFLLGSVSFMRSTYTPFFLCRNKICMDLYAIVQLLQFRACILFMPRGWRIEHVETGIDGEMFSFSNKSWVLENHKYWRS